MAEPEGLGLVAVNRLSDRSRWAIPLLAFAAGAVAALGQAPFDLVPLSLLGYVAGLILFLPAPGVRAGFFRVWAFGVGHFALALFWIVEPFFVDVARHGWMAPFALLLMSGGLALFWGAAGAVAAWIGLSSGTRAFAWAGALSLAELARGHVLTGFPWASVGHIWIDTHALALSRFGGAPGLTLLTLLAVALGWVMARQGGGRLALLPLPALAIWGLGVAVDPLPEAAQPGPTIRLVQPNAPQHEKWDPEKALVFFRRQVAFTAAAADPAPDLIVWPETAIPWLLAQADPALERIGEAAAGTPVVLGVQRREGLRAFNALAVLGEGGAVEAVYDKHHLVPFGEYIPLGQLARLLGLRSFAARDGYGYSPGPGPETLDLGELGTAVPLICYEAIFPRHISAVARPEWLLQITNDAWFGEISGPYQHLAQARLRAAEQGLPMVRVANTGISAVIDAYGNVTHAIPLGEAGWFDAPLPAPRPPTVYARFGDTLPFAAMIGLLAGLAAARSRFSD